MHQNNRIQWHKLLFAVALLILPLAHAGAEETKDLLLYSVSDSLGQNRSLILYDPAAKAAIPMPDYVQSSNAVLLSADGRLAFSTPFEGRIEVHLWDSQHPDQLVTSVPQVGDGDEYLLAWSADGHSLAFTRHPADDPAHPLLYVWDGGPTAVNITPPDIADQVVQYLRAYWSPDGRSLAFTWSDGVSPSRLIVWDGTKSVDPLGDAGLNVFDYEPAWSCDGRLAVGVSYYDNLPSAIYIWDGQRTMQLTKGPIAHPAWSADGRLAFLLDQGDSGYMLVWDGVSLKDGVPDPAAFANAAPEVSTRSNPVWSAQDQLAFVGTSIHNSHSQVYGWDGTTSMLLNQNPNQDNTAVLWGPGDLWTYTAWLADQNFLYIRDAGDQPLSETKGPFSFNPAWSASGYLMACKFDKPDWVLMVWNGQAMDEVARGATIGAQWGNDSRVLCSSG